MGINKRHYMKRSNFINYFSLAFLFLGFNNGFAQNKDEIASFDNLSSLFDAALQERNLERSTEISSEQLRLAKRIKDSLRIGIAYNNMVRSSEDLDWQISYSDSVIRYTKLLDNPNYPALGFISKSDAQIQKNQFKKAMENLLIAEVLADKYNNVEIARNILPRIAYLKTYAGDFQEALDINRKYLKLIKTTLNTRNNITPNILHQLRYHHLLAYNNKAQSLKDLNQMDSAIAVLNESKSYVLEYNLPHTPNLEELEAEVNYSLGNTDLAYQYFIESNKTAEDVHLATSFYYLGKISIDEMNYPLGILYLEKMDSMAIHHNYAMDYRKDGLETLSNAYEELDDTEKQLETINKYLIVDSTERASKQIISPFIENNFDKTRILREKGVLLEDIKQKTKTIRILTFLSIPISLLLIWFFYIRIKLKKRIQSLQKHGLIIDKKDSETPNKYSLSDEKIEMLAKVFKTVDESKLFLDSLLTQESLAKLYNTNTTDLSKYTNSILGTSFSNYLIETRIKHAISELNTDPSLNKYSLSGLANIFGFNNANSFSRAFTKITGVKPSAYRKSLVN